MPLHWHGRRCRKSACHSPTMARCATSSRRRTAMAPRKSSSNRWLHRPAVALVPKPRGQPDPLPRRFRRQQRARAQVTPAKHGKGNKAHTCMRLKTPRPANAGRPWPGFCSCKTGIHAIHGNNLGTALETGVQHRHRDLQRLRWPRQDHRLHPTAGQGLFLQSFAFPHPWRSDAGGTTPGQALFLQCFCISSVVEVRMEEVERSRRPEPRATQGAVTEKIRWSSRRFSRTWTAKTLVGAAGRLPPHAEGA